MSGGRRFKINGPAAGKLVLVGSTFGSLPDAGDDGGGVE